MMKEKMPASFYALIGLKWLFRILGVMSVLCVLGLVPKPDDDNFVYVAFIALWAVSEYEWLKRKKNGYEKAD